MTVKFDNDKKMSGKFDRIKMAGKCDYKNLIQKKTFHHL